ncbi:MAG TPA: arylamine N-acetyltransferase, partial [Thermoanaerobaculia bacterium]|nr:arylamine N-acetyltransferase [Thermoanaerobaculia bacterium]
MNADDILEALGLPRRRPDLAYLRDLFDAFSRIVPFESASKIVRDSEIEEPDAKPRQPETFWEEHLALGTGGTCFARVAAFSRLTESLGFSPVVILGGIMGSRNHASALFALGGRTWLADAGYPLPALLPLESGLTDSPAGTIDFAVSGNTAALRFVSGPEAGRVIDFSLEPAAEDEFRAAWRRTFSRSSLFLRNVVLRKPEGHRVFRFFRGTVDVTDAHSRARIPLAEPRPRKLAGLFGVDEDLLARAFEIAGNPDPERPTARV